MIGGIVVTGGGSQLKHMNQLIEFTTGMDSRVGYPNEHLSSSTNISVTSPLFATGVGLVAKGFEQFELFFECFLVIVFLQYSLGHSSRININS